MATLLDAIERLPGNIVGHFYVPALFGHWPDDATLDGYEDAMLDACRSARHGDRVQHALPLPRPYRRKRRPGTLAAHRRLLAKCKARNVGIAVGSDAHSPKDQGGAFARVLELLDECEINELVFPSAAACCASRCALSEKSNRLRSLRRYHRSKSGVRRARRGRPTPGPERPSSAIRRKPSRRKANRAPNARGGRRRRGAVDRRPSRSGRRDRRRTARRSGRLCQRCGGKNLSRSPDRSGGIDRCEIDSGAPSPVEGEAGEPLGDSSPAPAEHSHNGQAHGEHAHGTQAGHEERGVERAASIQEETERSEAALAVAAQAEPAPSEAAETEPAQAEARRADAERAEAERAIRRTGRRRTGRRRTGGGRGVAAAQAQEHEAHPTRSRRKPNQIVRRPRPSERTPREPRRRRLRFDRRLRRKPIARRRKRLKPSGRSFAV